VKLTIILHKDFLRLIIVVFTFTLSLQTFAQNTSHRKGTISAYWGYNRGWFSNSNIRFWGTDYDFTLDKVSAKDRQSKFDLNTYFGISNITIPQYDIRLGYAITDHWDITIGTDHMKYVVVENQTAVISGEIAESNSGFDGTYDNDKILLSPDFLHFEHTDGLNYWNIEARRFDEIFSYKKVSFNLTEGGGVGVLIPRTNTTLLKNDSYDEFHLAGYGLSAVVAANITFFKHFFIQTELKGGFIHMPDIRTTMSPEDRASQHFFFTQWNVVGGVQFDLTPNRSI